MITKCKLLLKSCRNTYQNRLRELKNKGKDQFVSPKSGRSRLSGRSLRRAFGSRSLSDNSNGAITMVVVTRAGRFREWSQGELRLYVRLGNRQNHVTGIGLFYTF